MTKYRPARSSVKTRDAAMYRANPIRRKLQKAPRALPATMQSQLKSILAGKNKDSNIISRIASAITGTNVSCLSSATDFTYATSLTGLLDTNQDECLIKHINIKQNLRNFKTVHTASAGVRDCFIRTIIVWYNKAQTVADVDGGLPPVTEFLTGDSLHAMYKLPADNAGRWVILYDKTDNMGTNIAGYAILQNDVFSKGDSLQRDIKIKVDKRMSFAKSAGFAGGHYDSDVEGGLVDKGLICMYTLVDTGAQTASGLYASNGTSLSYVG